MRPLRHVLVAATVAGLIAGGLAAVFHLVLTESVIDRAIAAEDARRGTGGHSHEAPVVSRRGQKIGLVVGLLLYGAFGGVLVGIGLYVTRDVAPAGWRPGQWGLVVASLTGWAIALFPFLKYPANPPGVGEPDTIGYRQALYVTFVLLSALGVWLAAALRRRVHAATTEVRGWVAPAVFYGGWALGLYAFMPSSPDPVLLPAAIVRPFRALSLAGLVVFWGALGLGLALLLREDTARRHHPGR
jgi:hypothetical protein